MERALPDLRLARVDPGRLDADEQLAGSGHRRIYVHDLEHVDPAVTIESDSACHQL